MVGVFTRRFWLHVLERATKTFAQVAAALITGNGLGILDVDWTKVLSVAGLAFVYSVLMSVASSETGEKDSPSLVP